MQLPDLAVIVASVLLSLGGGGAIVLGLSGWLGKVWAERLMEKEKARYQKDLEDFKAQLNRDSDRTAQTLREKLSLYKEAIPPIVDLVARYQLTPAEVTPALLTEFEKKRLATSAMLGMFAALPVFEAYNALIDYIFQCLEAKRHFLFPEFRALSYKVLSEVRRDVGISGDELVYRGER
jgi:hypothetical protein